MKNLIVKFTVLVALLLAGQAIAQDSDTNQGDKNTLTFNGKVISIEIDESDDDAEKIKKIIAAANQAMEASDGSNQIKLDIEIDDDTDSQDITEKKFEKVTSILRNVLGDEVADEVGSELKREFEQLTEEQKQEFAEELDKEFTFRVGSSDGGFPETAVAIVAIVMVFGMPILIVLIVVISRSLARRQKMKLIRSYIDSGKDVPEAVLADFESSWVQDPYQSGLKLVAIGAALVIGGFFIGEGFFSAIGLIPLFIGISRLMYWKQENKDS